MNNLQIFNNKEFGEIRTVTIDNEPWFVGKDVSTVLGYSNVNKAVAMHVDEYDKKVLDFKGFSQNRTTSALWSGNDFSNKIIINESGLYALIFGSKLESAKRFKRWVTSEVLPAIRKHGVYAVDELLNNPDMAIKAFTALKEEREKNKILQADNNRMKPKEIFADAVATSHTSILVGELAKILRQNGVNIGQNRLFAILREEGYLIKRKGTDYNMPTQKSMDLGLFEIKEGSYTDANGCNKITKTTKVTGKGQQYFINRFLPDRQEVMQL